MTTAAASPFSKARIEALSDGVFAIAMTLLVLEIKVPELPRTTPSGELWHALGEHWTIFFSFFITFLLAGQFWIWHHIVFHHTKRVNQGTVFFTVFFLMFVSLLPFSTAMLGAFSLRQPVTLAFYFGNQLALGLLLNLQWWYAKRRRDLEFDPGDTAAIRFEMLMATQLIASVAALGMVAVNPRSAFMTYALTQALCSGFVRKRAKTLAARAQPREQAVP